MPNFAVGTRDKVDVMVAASCCLPGVHIRAVDVNGNEVVHRQSGTRTTIAGQVLVLGSVLATLHFLRHLRMGQQARVFRYTIPERLSRVKHSILLDLFVSYERKWSDVKAGPSVCQSVSSSVRQSVCPSVCLSISLSVRQSVCLSVCMSVSMSVHQFVRHSICLALCLSVWSYVSLSVYPWTNLS